MEINWIDDEAGIAVLQDVGIDVSDVTIAVDAINRKASAENRARKNPLDESRLDGIRSAYQRRIPVPKIVVRKDPRHGCVIAGGNHRFGALNGEVVIPVHQIQCTDAEFEMACKLLNTVVGDGMSREDRIANALNDHERLGVDRKTACKVYGIKESALADAIKHREVIARIASLPTKTRDAVTLSHAKALGDLAKNQNVMRAAANAIASTKMSVKDFSNVAREAREANTEAEQVVVFERCSKLYRQDAERVVPRRIKQTFLSACGKFKNLKDKKTWESLEFSQAEIPEAKIVAMEVINILNSLCKASG
jgi:hypothetical protein